MPLGENLRLAYDRQKKTDLIPKIPRRFQAPRDLFVSYRRLF